MDVTQLWDDGVGAKMRVEDTTKKVFEHSVSKAQAKIKGKGKSYC